MVISGEKAVQQLEELLILMINSFEGVKDVVKFMSFEELEIVGFQTKTNLEYKSIKNQIEGSIDIGELEEGDSLPKIESQDGETISRDSVDSDPDPEAYQQMYNGTKKKREELGKQVKDPDRLELSAIVEKIKDKTNNLKQSELSQLNNKSGFESNDSFTKFTQSNFIKGRDPKLQKHSKPGIGKRVEEKKSPSNITSNKEKYTEDIKRLIYPETIDLNFNAENAEEFLSKHWIELMEVIYTLIKDIFIKIGNIEVSDEVMSLFSHVKSLSNRNISHYIYERLFSKQKLSLDQNWFKNSDRIETLERQKKDLKKEIQEMHELMMNMSNNSHSITSLQPKSRQQSIENDEIKQVRTSRNYDSELKDHDTADFGGAIQSKEGTLNNNEAIKKLTLRSGKDEQFSSKLMEDSKLDPIKHDDKPLPISREKSITMRKDPNLIKTEERFTSQQSNQDYIDEGNSNYEGTLSKASNTRKVSSKKSQNYFRNKNKKSIKEELQMLQDIRDLEKEKEVLERQNTELLERLDHLNKDSIKWKSAMVKKIVELEDQIQRLKNASMADKTTMKDEYARDLMKVSKLSKQRELNLVESIRDEIRSEYLKCHHELKVKYTQEVEFHIEKLDKVQQKYLKVKTKEEELRFEYNRFIKEQEFVDFKKN